jgi:hypothetical protein
MRIPAREQHPNRLDPPHDYPAPPVLTAGLLILKLKENKNLGPNLIDLDK